MPFFGGLSSCALLLVQLKGGEGEEGQSSVCVCAGGVCVRKLVILLSLFPLSLWLDPVGEEAEEFSLSDLLS